MTDHTDEELIALAKKCGITGVPNSNPVVMQALLPELRAFASALRQQDMARLARMRERASALIDALNKTAKAQAEADNAVENYSDPRDYIERHMHALIAESEAQRKLAEALSETSDIQAWMDGQRAQWQDIATAPKDGTVFLGYRNGKFGEAYFIERHDSEEAWSFRGYCGCVSTWPEIKPIHWMPLPDAPSARSTKGEG